MQDHKSSDPLSVNGVLFHLMRTHGVWRFVVRPYVHGQTTKDDCDVSHPSSTSVHGGGRLVREQVYCVPCQARRAAGEVQVDQSKTDHDEA